MIAEKAPTLIKGKVFQRATSINECQFIYFKDVKKSTCSFCKVVHDDNRTYAYLAPTSKLFIKCNKSNESRFIHNYGEETKAPPRTVDTDIIFKNYPHSTFDEDYCMNDQSFMDTLTQGKDTAIIANMGTGKTWAAAKHAGSLPKNKMGIISFRISLAKKYREDFEGFACYLNETKSQIGADRWVCQLDSLYRIKQTDLDTLYIDEVSQVRRHTTASTFMKNRNYLNNLTALDKIITNAK